MDEQTIWCLYVMQIGTRLYISDLLVFLCGQQLVLLNTNAMTVYCDVATSVHKYLSQRSFFLQFDAIQVYYTHEIIYSDLYCYCCAHDLKMRMYTVSNKRKYLLPILCSSSLYSGLAGFQTVQVVT
jgi:hypothetical protein